MNRRRVDRDDNRVFVGDGARHVIRQQGIFARDKSCRDGCALNYQRRFVVNRHDFQKTGVVVVNMDGCDQVDRLHAVDVV